MGMEERKYALDNAPDWINQTYGQRIAGCIQHLLLFNFLTQEEAMKAFDRAEQWFNKSK